MRATNTEPQNGHRRTEADSSADAMIWLGTAYDEFAPTVFGLALRVTRSRQAAEEICQDVFLRLWRTREFDGARGSLRSWLSMIAHGAAVDWVRREVRAEQRLMCVGMYPDLAVSVEESLLSAEMARTTREAIATLPNKQREAICLAFFDGLSHTEISTATGTPVGTVKTRIRDGMKRLSRVLVDLRSMEPIGVV